LRETAKKKAKVPSFHPLGCGPNKQNKQNGHSPQWRKASV